jgi:hypothetical protein
LRLKEVYQRVANPNSVNTTPLNRYEGFNNDGVINRDMRFNGHVARWLERAEIVEFLWLVHGSRLRGRH